MSQPSYGHQLLKAALKTKSLSQRKLEKTLGLSKGTVSRWLNDGRMPRIESLVKLDELLGVSVTAWAKPSQKPTRKPAKSPS